MKALVDPARVLAEGLKAIREQYKVPTDFPAEVQAAAEAAAGRAPTEHVDRTDRAFVTLDPASATDLDQAFAIEASGQDLLLHYAIADVAWFVEDGDLVDAEAWRRGETLYLPDGKARLYPAVISEGAASLLPDGPRPAVIFTTRVAPDGSVRLEGAERGIVRSRAKLAYDSAGASDLPSGFAELARRIQDAERRRAAARVDPPEQEVEMLGDDDFRLAFRPLHETEIRNAALSLATNLAVADALLTQGTGLFRVMAEPDARAVSRLRHAARALEVDWPGRMSLVELERRLRPDVPNEAALMLAIRRAGNGAGYEPYKDGVLPWHAAMAATYVHATAPLRRLADRYVVRAALAVANGQAVSETVAEAFQRLPKVMARADGLAGQVERAVVDLAEAVVLSGAIGRVFRAVVTDVDQRGARAQLCGHAVVMRVDAPGAAPGDALRLRLVEADPAERRIAFRIVE